MSLVSFRARNHPQQVGRYGPAAAVDDRGTTAEMFAPLHERFRFTLDAAASEHNAKLPRYFDIEQDGLVQTWRGERVWCNPPYSDIRPWVLKAWGELLCPLTVMLLPSNRTEQAWWQDLIEPHRDQGSILRVEFLRGRPRFDRPNAVIGPKGDRPPFGCCLLIWERP